MTLAVVLALAGALGGCTSDDDPPPAAASSSEPAAPPASCTPGTLLGSVLEGGSGDGTSVWALLERTKGGPLRAGEEVKIVLRMTGEGDLEVSPTKPDGSPAEVAWGPEIHGGSNFRHPGEEWGFGVRFSEPGCWTIALSRTESGSGYLQLEVV